MFIGSVARQTGLSVKAIRFYEREGLIPVPPRSGRYRQYDAATVEQLRLIRDARALGLTIAGLKGLIQRADGRLDWPQVATFLHQQKARIQSEIAQREVQLAHIEDCLAQIESCPELAGGKPEASSSP